MSESKKQEKEGFFRRTANRFSKWFREMRAELKKVVWPTKKQVLQNTVVVLIAVLVVGAFIWIFDAISNLVVQWLIGLFN